MVRPACAVLGGGVSGLTSALKLLEAGWDVHLVAKEIAGTGPVALPSSSLACGLVSQGAGGLWEYPPYKVEPAEQAGRWALETLAPLQALAAAPDETGVRTRRANVLFRRRPRDWEESARALRAVLPGYAEMASDTLPGHAAAHLRHGYAFDAPVCFMPLYLAWLRRSCVDMGAHLHSGVRLTSLQHASSLHAQLQSLLPQDAPRLSLVVNCLGLANRALNGDMAMVPVRGALVHVHCPEVQQVFMDEDDATLADGLATYVIPQAFGLVACGGTGHEGQWSEQVSREEASAILSR